MKKVGHVRILRFADGAIETKNVLSRSVEVGSVLEHDNDDAGGVMSRPLR